MKKIALVTVDVAGFPCPMAVVTLDVLDRCGGFVPVRFKVDPGADLSAIPIAKADECGIPFRRVNPGISGGLVGAVARYRGTIGVRVMGERFEWPCVFLETPAASSGRRMTGTQTTPVLGRAGFLAAFDICFGRRYLTVARRGSLRELWMRMLLGLVGECNVKDPL